LISAAQGCVLAGLPEEAAALYPLVAERVEQLPINVFDLALAQRVAGMAAAAGGLWDEAVAHFEIARRQADEIPVRLEQPQVSHWFGKMLLDRGRPEDRDRGREMIEAALEDYKAFGMPLHIARAEEMLARASS
jgi:hypothetical protein